MRVLTLVTVVLIGLISGCGPKHTDSTNIVEQYIKDTTAIKKYLTDNSIPAIRLSNGIWFIIDSQGSGNRGVFDDTVGLTYKMKLIPSGTVGDEYSTPTDFKLSDMPLAIQYVLPYFQKGGKGRIFFPSYYGYQSNPQGAIPPNSPLIFDFSLLSIKDSQIKVDTTAIDDYLFNHDIGAFKDPSGLRYKIDTLGNGSSVPDITDSVTVKYTAKFFSGTVLASQTTPVRLLLSDLILGWKIGLPLVPEGSYITLYIPSGLAWGPSPSPTLGILPNTNMIFTIKLVKVHHN